MPPLLIPIRPGFGFGDLVLGMPVEQARSLIEDCEVAHADEHQGQQFETWTSDQIGLMVNANLTADRLYSITTWNTQTELLGKRLIDQLRSDVMRELHGLGLIDDPCIEITDHEDHQTFSYPSHGYALKFFRGVLKFIAVNPRQIDGQPVWPNMS